MTRDPHAYAAEVRARRAALPCVCPACVQVELLPAILQIVEAQAKRTAALNIDAMIRRWMHPA